MIIRNRGNNNIDVQTEYSSNRRLRINNMISSLNSESKGKDKKGE